MLEKNAVSNDAKCPGCHFGCMLVKYQCGRGKEFYDLAASGGELPERRGPMMTPSEAAARPDGRPPLNDRVMHGLNIMSNRLRERHEQSPNGAVLTALERSASFMSLPILQKRTHVPSAVLDSMLEEACQEELVTLEEDEHAGRIARLTDEGRQRAAEFKAQRDASTAEFLSALSDDEKKQLVTLVRKLLGMR